MKPVIAVLLSALTASTALAQSSFNIDINTSSGSGAGVPAQTFGAAAGQTGFWNDINPATAVSSFIANTTGGTPGTVLTRSTAGFANGSNAGATGEFAKLVGDLQKPVGLNISYSFSNLANGDYAVYTYALDAGNCGSTAVEIANAVGDTIQTVTCSLSASNINKFKLAGTHSLHVVNVTNGQLTITIHPGITSAACAGIQLKYLGVLGKLRIYVNDNASGANTGTSWADAYTDLQSALADAVAAGPAYTEIWVAQGFYYPTSGTSRSATFTIPSGLEIYGGFAGNETTLAQRTNPGFYITALSGNLPASASNSYTVVNADNTSSQTLIDGFSIANGDNDNTGSSTGKGGGVTLDSGNAQFRNCKFLSNNGSTEGGAVYSTGGSPTFVNCLFYNNTSDNGAGGAAYHHTSGNISFYNCTFLQNSAFQGGAVELSFSEADFYNCLFNGNTANASGGAMYIGGTNGYTRIGNCTFVNNASSQAYGGLQINEGVNSPTDVRIANSIFWGNTDGVSADNQTKNLHKSGAGNLPINNTTIQGWSGTLGGTANNGSNPLFVDINGADNIAGNSDDNVHLLSNSPACDSGNNNSLLSDFFDIDGNGITGELLPIDLDGMVRRVDNPSVSDTGVGSAPIVDRGCYEFSFHAGDLDCNNTVNTLDVDDFVQAELNPAAYALSHPACSITLADMNGDGLIDALDIQLFVNCVILGQCP